MTPEEARDATKEHIARVGHFLGEMATLLLLRAEQHDASKLESPEWEMFKNATEGLRGLTYGSPEYKDQCRELLGPALDHHYANNRHHPEHTFCQEEWKPVAGYEGLYEVSDLGRVRGLPRVVRRKKQGDLAIPGGIRKFHVTPKGYCRIQLKDKGGNPHNHFVHILVANAFLGDKPNERIQVNHRSGNKTDNSLENLEYLTPSQNLNHAYDTGLREPNVKYVVRCIEHDIVTFGIDKMAEALRTLGCERIRPSGIWRCITEPGYSTHQDLTFESWNIDEYKQMNSPVNGMTFIDLMEMFCDHMAAAERHADGCPYRSLEINTKRFGFSPQLASILKNTIDEILPKKQGGGNEEGDVGSGGAVGGVNGKGKTRIHGPEMVLGRLSSSHRDGSRVLHG